MKIDAKANQSSNQSRDKIIVKTSMFGVLANVFLAACKAAVGLLSNSIAVLLDAVNNISDAASSVITIVGTALAGKAPDKKHPFGYGRVEYMSALVISTLVLYAGITSLVESVKKIIRPETPDYSATALVIIALAVVVKIALGRHVKRTGKKVNSDSLVNSGKDATLDAIISASTLLAAIVYVAFGVSVESWLGAVISLVIIKSGIEMLRETVSKILGESAGVNLVKEIKKMVASFPDVQGVYDLVLNNYGPDAYNGSVHIAVADTLSMRRLDELVRDIAEAVYEKYNVALTGVGIYSVNTQDARAVKMQDEIRKRVMAHEYVLQMHGFYVNEAKRRMSLDVVVSFAAPDRRAVYEEVAADIRGAYPDYDVRVAMDADFNEI